MGGRGFWRSNGGRRARAARLAAAAALAALLAGLVVPILQADEPRLSAYSDRWDDLSEMRSIAEGSGLDCRCLLSGPAALSEVDAGESVLVVVGVERAYSEEELAAVRSFLQRGGNVLVADDFGQGGALLGRLTGSRVGLLPQSLRDIRFQKHPDFVRVQVRPGNTLGLPALDLLLNHPAALRLELPYYSFGHITYGANLEVLVNASGHAWLDVNDNLERDADEQESPYPVAAMYRLETGSRVLAVSDPGIFINDMIGRAGNHVFVSRVLELLGTERTTLIFDESRHSADGAAAAAGMGAVRLGAGFAASAAAVFLVIFGALMASIFLYARLPPPPARRHRDILGEARLLHFRTPEVGQSEFQRLRVAIVEKVRLAYGIAPEEFYPAMLPRLPSMLADPALQRFLDYESWPDTGAFAAAIHRAECWAPPQASPYDPQPGFHDPRPGTYDPRPGPCDPEPAPSGGAGLYDVEAEPEPAPETLDMDGALFGGSGAVRIWDPGNRRGRDSDADSILYGEYRDGSGRPSVPGGGGQ